MSLERHNFNIRHVLSYLFLFDYLSWTESNILRISNSMFFFFLFRASGKILKAYAQDFEALSKDGHLFVVVQNTGYVTADFAVSATLMDTVPIPSVF